MGRPALYTNGAEKQKAYRDRLKARAAARVSSESLRYDTTIKHQPLRYHGGKWNLTRWLLSHFPAHSTYVEPFAGGLNVLLRKGKSNDIISDLDPDVINFWQVIRNSPDDLIQQLTGLAWSREVYTWAMGNTADDPVTRAVAFYCRHWMSFGSGNNCTGFREVPARSIEIFKDPAKLLQSSERLQNVTLLHADALEVIRQYDSPGTLFYLDPPYVVSSRKSRWAGRAYRCEMSDQQHMDLATVLGSIRGNAVISGYDCPLYADLYGSWARYEKQVRTNTGQAVECLWVSPQVDTLTRYPLLNWFSNSPDQHSGERVA